ncbi:hypothetical protein NMG60_11002333 [Bertholletia excelsa]
MSIYSSSDSDDDRRLMTRPFGRERSIYEILGGGKVADVLLWKDKRVSAAILAGVATIWFLFEVVEYSFLTLFCHVIMTTMLVIFIWSMAAEIFKWDPPRIPDILLYDDTYRNIITVGQRKLDQFLFTFFDIALGNNFKQFVLAIVSLWVLSVLGNYINTLNLLFFGCLCLETLPYLYERYEDEVDEFLAAARGELRRSYRQFDREVIRKIPRKPAKAKKTK